MATVKIRPSAKEQELLKNQFNEAAFMQGTEVEYSTVKNVEITDISSEYFEWNEPVTINIIYDERPKVSLLKRLHWYSEDESIQPKIIYVPKKVNEEPFLARRGDVVNVDPLNELGEAKFQVSEVRGELLTLWWICNIVPFRERKEPDHEPTRQNKWLNV